MSLSLASDRYIRSLDNLVNSCNNIAMLNGKSTTANIVRTGFVCSQWKFPAETQRRILLREGVPEKRIKEDDLEGALALLRGDEVLETAGGFRALGGGRYSIMGKFEVIRAAGKVLMDCETKMRSDTHAVDMLNIALAKIHGEKTAPDHEEAVRRGQNAAEVRWQDMKENRLSLHEARDIWLITGKRGRKIRKNGQALKQMPGWTQRSAYKEFGASGRPSGNPGGPQKK